MKRLLLAGAAALMLTAPALAQTPNQPPESAAPPQQADAGTTTEAEGELLIQGVTPAQALGAIDPSKLTQSAPPEIVAEAEVETVVETGDETEIAQGDAELSSQVLLEDLNAPVTEQVADVVESGSYSTKDLVRAELAAMEKRPPS
ncbi:MAG: hypothetical protein R3C52_07400 [Hyphomonadaceae bacterium]